MKGYGRDLTYSDSLCLYIPHGSDESAFSASLIKDMYFSFISHMVQMKVPELRKAELIEITLYPTWFRWKV